MEFNDKGVCSTGTGRSWHFHQGRTKISQPSPPPAPPQRRCARASTAQSDAANCCIGAKRRRQLQAAVFSFASTPSSPCLPDPKLTTLIFIKMRSGRETTTKSRQIRSARSYLTKSNLLASWRSLEKNEKVKLGSKSIKLSQIIKSLIISRVHVRYRCRTGEVGKKRCTGCSVLNEVEFYSDYWMGKIELT